MQAHGEISRTADVQSRIANCPNVAFRNVVGKNLCIMESRQMRSNYAAQRATPNNTDLYGHRGIANADPVRSLARLRNFKEETVASRSARFQRAHARLTPLCLEVV